MKKPQWKWLSVLLTFAMVFGLFTALPQSTNALDPLKIPDPDLAAPNAYMTHDPLNDYWLTEWKNPSIDFASAYTMDQIDLWSNIGYAKAFIAKDGVSQYPNVTIDYAYEGSDFEDDGYFYYNLYYIYFFISADSDDLTFENGYSIVDPTFAGKTINLNYSNLWYPTNVPSNGRYGYVLRVENGGDRIPYKRFDVAYDPGDHGTWSVGEETYTGLVYKDNMPWFGYSSGKDYMTEHDPGWSFTGWVDDQGTPYPYPYGVEYEVTRDVIYTAQWAPIEYTVTFTDDRGGMFWNPAAFTFSGLHYGDPTPPDPVTLGYGSWAGWNFVGWNPALASTVTENVTYIAYFDQLYYNVHYEANGGAGAPVDYNYYTVSEMVTVMHGEPTLAGYVFMGWLCQQDGNTYTEGDQVPMPGYDLTFTAKWKPVSTDTYTVTYHPGVPYSYVTASWKPVEHKDLAFGDSTPAPPADLTSDFGDHFIFNGWLVIPADDWPLDDPTDTSSCTKTDNPVLDSRFVTVTQSVVYEATYAQQSGVLIVYEPGIGGIWDYPADHYDITGNMIYEYIECLSSADYAALGENERNFPEIKPGIIKEDYIFTSWEKTSSSRDVKFDAFHGGWTGAEVWTAQWTKPTAVQYTVLLYPGEHGTFGLVDDYIDVRNLPGWGLTLADIEDSLSVDPAYDFHDPGWKFVGWDNEVDWNEPLTEDVIITALWEAIPYDITYYLDGGENHEDNPDTYTVEDTVTLYNPYGRHGYSFHGWFTGPNGTGDKVENIPEGSIGDIELYAYWVVSDVYNVTFDPGEGAFDDGEDNLQQDGTVEAEVKDGDTAGSVKPGDPSRPGFKFVGWNTRHDGSGDGFDGDAPVDRDMTFYAVWEGIVTVNGSYAGAGNTGAGSYAVGEPVTIDAGTRSGYTFTGWTVTSGGVELANADSATTGFTMIDGPVTVTANWRANGGGYYDGGDDNGGGGGGPTGGTTTTITPIITPTTPVTTELTDQTGGDNGQTVTELPDDPEPLAPSPMPYPQTIAEGNSLELRDDGTYVELGLDGVPLGEWHWDEEIEEWVFDEYLVPMGVLPNTRDAGLPLHVSLIYAFLLAGMSLTALTGLRRRHGAHLR